MYVDETGDCGFNNSPTKYFVLSGLVIHELKWYQALEELLNFRQSMRDSFGLKLREEFHSARFINNPGKLIRIKRNDRLSMIRFYAKHLAKIDYLSVINVVIDKSSKPNDYDVFDNAWKYLIQRFENTLSNHNFPNQSNADERGLLICDHTDDKKLRNLIRKMRHYNPISHTENFGNGYRNVPLQFIIEDAWLKNSLHSYFIQSVDLIAYLLYQKLNPNSYMKKKNGYNYFNILEPILCKSASKKNKYGIVYY